MVALWFEVVPSTRCTSCTSCLLHFPQRARPVVVSLACKPLPPWLPLPADALLQRDALRPLPLVVEDLANLAIALCAHEEQMEPAWRVLAAQCGSRAAEGSGLTQGGLLWLAQLRLCC